MFMIRNLKLEVLGLAAAVVWAGGVAAGPPSRGNGGGGGNFRSMQGSSNFKPGGFNGGSAVMKPPMQGNGGNFKLPTQGNGNGGVFQKFPGAGQKMQTPIGGQQPKGPAGPFNPGKGPVLDAGKGKGPFNPGGKGPVLDPGKGNGPLNPGKGPVLDPGKGNGPFNPPGKGGQVGEKGPNKGPFNPGGKGPVLGHGHKDHGKNGGFVPPWMQGPKHGHKGMVVSKNFGDKHYFQKCGVKKSFGYCYTGFNHNHWYCRSWSTKHGCWFFYDPGCCSWYYWCQPDACYYPCHYLPYQTYCYIVPTTYVATAVIPTPVETTVYSGPAPHGNPAPYGEAAPYGGSPPTGAPAGFGNAPSVAAGQPQPAGPTGEAMKLPPLPGEDE
jgi:hypothetical protein